MAAPFYANIATASPAAFLALGFGSAFSVALLTCQEQKAKRRRKEERKESGALRRKRVIICRLPAAAAVAAAAASGGGQNSRSPFVRLVPAFPGAGAAGQIFPHGDILLLIRGG